MSSGAKMEPACHLCGADVRQVAEFSTFLQVTSDCRPWRGAGRLGVCIRCKTVQKQLDAAWHQDCSDIYASYAVYNTSGGHEQLAFDQLSGAAASRSSRLVARVLEVCPLPQAGRLLDIGCGNGAFLAAFGAAKPSWQLTGAEVNETNRAAVESLPGVEEFHCGDVTELPGQFDVIVMIHCLEHIPGPATFLRHLAKLLAPNGLLVIEVPNLATNPFDVLIADHASHFTAATLQQALLAGGFRTEIVSDHWVAKELSLLARPSPQDMAWRSADADDDPDLAANAVAWLGQFLALAKAESEPVAVFGTSIAGTWLAAELGEHVRFFIDEDRHRIGKMHVGRPVLAASEAPAGTVVMAPFPPSIARDIARRLPRLTFRFLPELENCRA